MYKFFKIILIITTVCLSTYPSTFANDEKIKIGLLVPLSGEYKELGELIIKSTKMALDDIGSNKIEIYPRDTNIDPSKTLRSAKQLKKEGVKIFIGPVFFKSITYLDEIEDVVFLSLTNKTKDIPNNVISSGVNSLSQINAIKKFLESNEIKKNYLSYTGS